MRVGVKKNLRLKVKEKSQRKFLQKAKFKRSHLDEMRSQSLPRSFKNEDELLQNGKLKITKSWECCNNKSLRRLNPSKRSLSNVEARTYVLKRSERMSFCTPSSKLVTNKSSDESVIYMRTCINTVNQEMNTIPVIDLTRSSSTITINSDLENGAVESNCALPNNQKQHLKLDRFESIDSHRRFQYIESAPQKADSSLPLVTICPVSPRSIVSTLSVDSEYFLPYLEHNKHNIALIDLIDSENVNKVQHFTIQHCLNQRNITGTSNLNSYEANTHSEQSTYQPFTPGSGMKRKYEKEYEESEEQSFDEILRKKAETLCRQGFGTVTDLNEEDEAIINLALYLENKIGSSNLEDTETCEGLNDITLNDFEQPLPDTSIEQLTQTYDINADDSFSDDLNF